MNPLLMLDLDTAQTSLAPVADDTAQAFIGGRGLGVSILCEQHPVPDPLDPASPLCMLVGPLNSTLIPLANRLCFVFRSPQTRTIAWAHTGGYIAASLGAAGLSGLVLRGRAPAPIFLEVSKTGVAQRDAAELVGLGAIETTDRLRGARIIALERMYNLRLGVTSAADTLPSRFTEEEVPSGKHRGRTCDLPGLLDAYYRQRGWPHGDVMLPVVHPL
jgi:aldehyde:ferredoxin oxidoreductase